MYARINFFLWDFHVNALLKRKISSLFSFECFLTQLADGLNLEKASCPLGVLLVVFESRPDALVQVTYFYHTLEDEDLLRLKKLIKI